MTSFFLPLSLKQETVWSQQIALSLSQDVGGFKVGGVVAKTLLHSRRVETVIQVASLPMVERGRITDPGWV